MNNLWGQVLIGTIGGFILGTAIFVIVLFKTLPFLFSLKSKPLLTAVNIFKKISWQNYFEANMRAATGKSLDRPYGAKRAVFDQLQFNPLYLNRTPLNSDVKINTEVILGPKALKPLQLKIPILIGGMAYGSGYSLRSKIALAQAATKAGTAANSGNGPYLTQERQYAEKYIIQYTRGFWSKTAEILTQADMIEIALGHSARGPAPVRIKGNKLTTDVAKCYDTIPGLDVLMEARLPEVENIKQWQALIQSLKELTGGVPISVKFGASHFLEQELALFLTGGIDVIVFDGIEGGTHGGAPILMDDVGLPTFPALCRAAKYLREKGLKEQISLVVGGGLVTPGDFAKCLALGADAVIVGTITALAMSHTQTIKDIPWEPPTGSLYNDGKAKSKYNPELGAHHLNNYFQSCVREMELLARTLGKSSLRELNRSDLVALDPTYAAIAEVNYLHTESGS